MITPIVAFSADTMLDEFPIAGATPCRTMIKHLGCAAEGGATMLRKPFASGKPAHLGIHVTDNECRKRRESTFDLTELERLSHAYRLCNGAPEFIANLVIGLHVCIDKPELAPGATILELNTKPAFRDKGIESNSGQIGIKPGIMMFIEIGAPGYRQTRTKNTGNVMLPWWPDHLPSTGCECGGDLGMTTPDLLEGDDIGGLCEPLDNFMKGWR